MKGLLLAAACTGCAAEVAVELETRGIPVEARDLRVFGVRLGPGDSGVRTEPVPPLRPEGRHRLLFTLSPPATTDPLVLSVAARDGQQCLLRFGEATAPLPQTARDLSVVVTLTDPVPPGRCEHDLHVWAASPSVLRSDGLTLAGEAVPVVLRGWGFPRAPLVNLDGGSGGFAAVGWRSPSEVVVTAPPHRPGSAAVQVCSSRRPRCGEITLRYMAERVRLDPDEYSVGPGPQDLLAVDLGGDGYPELVTANTEDGSLTVLTNNGRGRYGAGRRVPAGPRPVALAALDLDGDSDQDVAVLLDEHRGRQPGALLLLRNDGWGTLVPVGEPTTVWRPPGALVALDIGRDLRTDLVLTSANDSKVALLRNEGLEQLRPEIPIPFPFATAVAAGDFDGDEEPDFAVVGLYGDLALHLAKRDELCPRAPWPCLKYGGEGALALAAADLNQDGALDLAMPVTRGQAVVLLMNDGQAGFRREGEIPLPAPSGDLVAVDFDLDGAWTCSSLAPASRRSTCSGAAVTAAFWRRRLSRGASAEPPW